MRNRFFTLLLAACVAGLCLGATVSSAQAPEKKQAPAAKPAKAAVAKYLVIVPHTAEECVKALDDMEASKALNKFDFGCESGDHTAYAMVMATSEQEALKMVPEDQRAGARAVKMTKFTAAVLKSIHEKMKS